MAVTGKISYGQIQETLRPGVVKVANEDNGEPWVVFGFGKGGTKLTGLSQTKDFILPIQAGYVDRVHLVITDDESKADMNVYLDGSPMCATGCQQGATRRLPKKTDTIQLKPNGGRAVDVNQNGLVLRIQPNSRNINNVTLHNIKVHYNPVPAGYLGTFNDQLPPPQLPPQPTPPPYIPPPVVPVIPTYDLVNLYEPLERIFAKMAIIDRATRHEVRNTLCNRVLGLEGNQPEPNHPHILACRARTNVRSLLISMDTQMDAFVQMISGPIPVNFRQTLLATIWGLYDSAYLVYDSTYSVAWRYGNPNGWSAELVDDLASLYQIVRVIDENYRFRVSRNSFTHYDLDNAKIYMDENLLYAQSNEPYIGKDGPTGRPAGSAGRTAGKNTGASEEDPVGRGPKKAKLEK